MNMPAVEVMRFEGYINTTQSCPSVNTWMISPGEVLRLQ